mgnify:CR=1 FL=1
MVGGGRTTPPMVEVEGVPPKFNPLQNIVDLEITFVSRDGKRVKGKIVGSEPVKQQAEQEWQRAVVESAKHWSEKYPPGKKVTLPVIEEGGRRFLAFEDIDSQHHFLPVRIEVKNFPRDWEPEEGVEKYEFAVQEIKENPRTKNLIVEVLSPEYAESEDQIKAWGKRVDERISKGKNHFMLSVDAVKEVKKDGEYVVLPNLVDPEFKFDAYVQVPKGWTPDQLKANDKGEVKLVYTEHAQARHKFQLLCYFEGFEPKKGVTPATAKAEPAGKGKELWDSLKGLVSPEGVALMEQLFIQLDSPELAAKGLSERLDVLRKLERLMAEERRKILANPEKFESDLAEEGRYKVLGLEKEKVSKEIQRVSAEIESAKKVLAKEGAEELARRTAEEAARTQERAQRKADLGEDIDEFRPLVQPNVEFRVTQEGLDIFYAEDVEALRQRKAELEKVYAVGDAWVRVGGKRKKEDGTRYLDQDFVSDLLLADGLVPILDGRITELERLASGAPASAPPPPPMPDFGLPAPLKVRAPTSAPDAVRPPEGEAQKLTAGEMNSWLNKNFFAVGEFLGLSASSKRTLEKMFGLTVVSEPLRIQSISVAQEEVELNLPDGTIGVMSIEQLYRMAQEMEGLANTVERAGIQTNHLVELGEEAVSSLLRSHLEEWIIKHPKQPIPTKVRVEGVVLVSGEVLLDVEGVDVGVVRVPLEAFAGLVTGKKVKVLQGAGPLEAEPSGQPSLERIRPTDRLVEYPLSPEVMVGQIWRYDGVPSRKNQLNPGGNFRVVRVDHEKGLVTVVTAKDEAAAGRAKSSAQPFMASREVWRGLPKTLVSGPRPEAKVGGVPVETAEVRLLSEIKAGQIYAYTGSDRPPFKINDQFRITGLNTEKKIVSFIILREEAEAKAKKQQVRPYGLRLDQWNNLKKTLLSGEPTTPPTPRPPGEPVILPAPPVGRGLVIEASYPPKVGNLEPPGSFTELIDLIRDRDLIELAKAEVKKRAGPFNALMSVFVGDPFGDMTRRIERIAKVSGDALVVNKTLQERLRDVMPAPSSVYAMFTELKQAEKSYRNAEALALKYTIDQFNQLLSGKKVGTEDDRVKMLESVNTELDHLQAANAKAHKVLELAPPAKPSS